MANILAVISGEGWRPYILWLLSFPSFNISPYLNPLIIRGLLRIYFSLLTVGGNMETLPVELSFLSGVFEYIVCIYPPPADQQWFPMCFGQMHTALHKCPVLFQCCYPVEGEHNGHSNLSSICPPRKQHLTTGRRASRQLQSRSLELVRVDDTTTPRCLRQMGIHINHLAWGPLRHLLLKPPTVSSDWVSTAPAERC